MLHAAAFNKKIVRVVLIEPYSSYRSIVMNRFYNSSLVSGTVAGALKSYDLPDLAASLAPRKLLVIGSTGAGTITFEKENITGDLSPISASYKLMKAENQLSIIPEKPLGQLTELFMDWIK